MRVIDLNADIGEADNSAWAASEAKILEIVSSANIACGGHAGNDETMRQTIRLAKKNGVSIGAHPSYPDKENFGRASLSLNEDISRSDLRISLLSQITRLAEIAAEESASVSYIKPHGALYNDAVSDCEKAELIIEVIQKLDPRLALLGGPKSEMTKAAEAANIPFVAEGFIDRRYTDDGHLLSRKFDGAVLSTDEARIDQTLGLVFEQSVKTDTGKTLRVKTDSLCLHGDSQGAVTTAIKTRKALETRGVKIQSFMVQKDF